MLKRPSEAEAMTEAEWLACEDPRLMLDYHRMKKAPRRLRLLATACVRRVVPADAAPVCNPVIDAAERYAAGQAGRSEFLAARKAVRAAARGTPAAPAVLKVVGWLTDDAMEALTGAIESARPLAGPGGKAIECGLIRCVFGNTFHPVTFCPEWRTETAVALARQMYDSRDFSAMPILADALHLLLAFVPDDEFAALKYRRDDDH
jgi:hypothetical protein